MKYLVRDQRLQLRRPRHAAVDDVAHNIRGDRRESFLLLCGGLVTHFRQHPVLEKTRGLKCQGENDHSDQDQVYDLILNSSYDQIFKLLHFPVPLFGLVRLLPPAVLCARHLTLPHAALCARHSPRPHAALRALAQASLTLSDSLYLLQYAACNRKY